MGYFAPWGRLHIRSRHFRNVQSLQQTDAHLQSSPTGHGRLQLVSRPQCPDCIFSPQLLLPMRKPSGCYATRRFHGLYIVTLFNYRSNIEFINWFNLSFSCTVCSLNRLRGRNKNSYPAELPIISFERM